jgi:hypothetical protein
LKVLQKKTPVVIVMLLSLEDILKVSMTAAEAEELRTAVRRYQYPGRKYMTKKYKAQLALLERFAKVLEDRRSSRAS